ncbi:hypothetical protein [Pseudovibrio sp. POLY-S9]|uniref:hypothetical protein n=1 Tax=Pseudovibrio sp. POLY-S9 TaxID=1576596 RepID=UPI00070BE156|nr:hypothetical protein [Pseudovibrio sp. POLY-S9]
MTTPHPAPGWHLQLISHNTGPLLQPDQSPLVSAPELQGHKLLDALAPDAGTFFLKREDLRLTLADTPEDTGQVAKQIRDLQHLYLNGWEACQKALNKMGRG